MIASDTETIISAVALLGPQSGNWSHSNMSFINLLEIISYKLMN